MELSTQYTVPKNSKSLIIFEEDQDTITLGLANPPRSRRSNRGVRDPDVEQIFQEFYPSDNDPNVSSTNDNTRASFGGPTLLDPGSMPDKDLR